MKTERRNKVKVKVKVAGKAKDIILFGVRLSRVYTSVTNIGRSGNFYSSRE